MAVEMGELNLWEDLIACAQVVRTVINMPQTA